MEIGSSDEEFWNLDDDMARAGDGLGNSERVEDIEDSLFDITGPEYYDLTKYDDIQNDGMNLTEAPKASDDEGMPFEAGSADVDMELQTVETDDETMTRSQPAEGLAADPGGTGLVVGAEAPYPVIEERPAGSKRGTTTKSESYRPSKNARTDKEAQVPGSSRVLSAQQLNARRQNERRAKEKAAEKAAKATVAVTAGAGPSAAKSRKVTAEEPRRLFGAVADFWEAKKRRLDTGLASKETSLSEER